MSPDHNQNDEQKPRSSFSSLTPSAVPLPQPEKKSRLFWRRARRGMVWCLGIGVVAFFLANLTASWLLNQELAAIVRRGEPLRLGELAPAHLTESENAASLYRRADAALVLTQAEEQRLRDSKGLEMETDVLAKNQAAITLTRQAAELPGCRFPIDYEAANLAGILLPHLGKMRHLADVMRAQALQESRTGQIDAALNDVAVMFRMSEHIAPEPILISGLTAIAIERIGYKTLGQILNEAALSPEQAHEFALRLPHTDWVAAIDHDLMGERCFGLWAFQYVSNPLEAVQLVNSPSALTSNIVLKKVLGALWSPLWKMDEIQYLRTHERQRTALLKPGNPMMSDDRMTRELPWYAICTRIMLPALSHMGTKRDQQLVYRRMAVVALALNAYRTTQGQYPDSLRQAETNWGVALPHDLYTEQPFLYKKEGKKALLYSVGPNRTDDGGKKTERIENHDFNSVQSGNVSVADDLVW